MSPATGAIRGPLESYHNARHRLAALVLAEIALQSRLQRLEDASTAVTVTVLNEWLSAAVSAGLFHHEAVALADPDLIAAARPRLERVIAFGQGLLRAESGPLGKCLGGLRASLVGLHADLESTGVTEALHRLRRHRAAGLVTEAAEAAEEAREEAGRVPPSVARCALLAELDRLAEARAEADALEALGAITALQSTALRLRLRQPDRAAETERRIGTDGHDPDKPWERSAIRAELELLLGDSRTAADRALEAVTAYEDHRLRLARDTLRASSADDQVVARAYHMAVLSHLALPGAESATFACAERSRSGFLDAVHVLDSARGQPAAVRAVHGWLQAETRWAARFEDAAETVRRGEALTDTRSAELGITEVERALSAAEADVHRWAPAAFTSWRGSGAVPDAAAVAQALPQDTLLLEYHLFDRDLVCWAMTRDRLQVERGEQWAHEMAATARRFHTACSQGGDEGGPGRLLADALLRPFSAHLAEYRRVLVVPPAQLSLVPFHALPWAGAFLGVTHQVSYLPAASLLTRSRPPERSLAELTALLVGAPATDPRRGLSDLPGTAAEVAAISRMRPGCQVLTGREANRAEVLKQAAGCGILHLATHGDVSDLAPHRSRLALADEDHLGMDDLLGPDLDPQLLVMSACDTGRGTATAGGDVLGLTRAAIISGARHAVVSLWPVDDVNGCLVITRMYRHLTAAAPAPVGTALVCAQREVRDLSPGEREQEFADLASRADLRRQPTLARARDSVPRGIPDDIDPRHPVHWAPFIHVGA